MAKPKPPELDFLVVTLGRLHHTRAHQLFEAIGFFRGQAPVLMALWEQEGLSQSELAEQMKVTPATMTRMVQRMEKAGVIERRADVEDQRVTRVYLLEAGRSILHRVEKVWRQLEQETFDGFDEQERGAVRDYLARMVANLVQAVGEDVSKGATHLEGASHQR